MGDGQALPAGALGVQAQDYLSSLALGRLVMALARVTMSPLERGDAATKPACAALLARCMHLAVAAPSVLALPQESASGDAVAMVGELSTILSGLMPVRVH